MYNLQQYAGFQRRCFTAPFIYSVDAPPKCIDDKRVKLHISIWLWAKGRRNSDYDGKNVKPTNVILSAAVKISRKLLCWL
jgi:hypothetical protein